MNIKNKLSKLKLNKRMIIVLIVFAIICVLILIGIINLFKSIFAKEYIEENFDRGISVADAASYVFLSQGYFTRAFREELGISPMAFLMKKRIEKACELLSNNEIKVSGVASQIGFSSPQRFNVAFRKQTGMTPMEYRRKMQK